jgi:hypothetical protein
MDDHALQQLLFVLASGTRSAAQPDNPWSPTPDCLPLSRFRTAALRDDWSAAESVHRHTCSYCQRTLAQVRDAVWHPAVGQLLHHPGRASDADVTYHVEEDRCRRCRHLADLLRESRFLRRLADRAPEERRERVLTSGGAARVPLTAPDQPVPFDHDRTAGLMTPQPGHRLYLERAGPPAPGQLWLLLMPDEAGQQERFLLPSPAAGREAGVAEVALERPPPDQAFPVLFAVDAGDLTAEDIPLLRARLTAAERQAWSREALTCPDLDPAVRLFLEGVVRRPDA